MIVIPAIDIIEGQAVRLYKGDYSKKEIIGQKIMDIAKYFNEIGAGAIHMVDLDGAKEGHMVNGEIITKVARLVDELGSVVILKNNAPRYLVIDFSKADDSAVAKDEDVLEISKRLLAQNKEAYEVLAK